MTTPDNPSSEDHPQRRPVDPEEALKDLGQQPRLDEEGNPTAFTAVPPPLHHADGAGAGGGAEPGPGEAHPRQQPQQQQSPYHQAIPQDAPPYGQQTQQPRQPGYAYPPPPGQGPAYGPQYGGAPYGTGQPTGMPPYATWGQRAGAWVIDNGVAVVGAWLAEVAYYDWANGLRVLFLVVGIAGALWAIYNAYLAGKTGQSTGKRMAGIRLARFMDGQVVGPAFGLLRLFMNVVFWVICAIPGILNYLWPLWDHKSQTWSDKIASSVVVRAR